MRFTYLIFLLLLTVTAASATRTSQEETNIKIIKSITKSNIQNWEKYFHSNFKHHLPYMKDGKQSYIEGMKNFFKNYPNYKQEGERYFADGEFVIFHGIGTSKPGDTGVAVMIYKLSNEKVIELWHVQQTVPKESRNVNSIF